MLGHLRIMVYMLIFFYQDASMSAMNDELPRLQEKLYYGQIHSRTDILEHFFSESSFKRYNPQVRWNVFYLNFLLSFLLLDFLINGRAINCRLLLRAKTRKSLFHCLH